VSGGGQPGLDADEYRRFQEFQRFQDYQRFVEAQQGGAVVPAPPGAPVRYPPPGGYQGWPGGPAPLPPGKPSRPPIWLIILRTKLVRRLITLGLVFLALYIAYQHFFGTDTSNPDALHPGAIQGSHRLAPDPQDAAAAVYHVIAETPPDTACLEFSNAGAIQFAHDLGTTTCKQAVNKIHGQLDGTALNAYSEVGVPESAQKNLSATTAEISSCGMELSAGPRLGVFIVTEDQFNEWQITGHRTEPDPCPAPPTTTAAPPTS
jgi:hypothetical protein